MQRIIDFVFRKLFYKSVFAIAQEVQQAYTIKGPRENLILGEKVKIGQRVEFDCRNGKIMIGDECHIKSDVKFLCFGGDITLEEQVSVNSFCMLYGQGGLHIGKYVRIATGTVLIPSNHNFQDRNKPIFQQGLTNQGIVVEEDVWLGAQVKVLDDVRIAKGSVVGSGSVVTKSLSEPYGVYVGVPAKLIKLRDA